MTKSFFFQKAAIQAFSLKIPGCNLKPIDTFEPSLEKIFTAYLLRLSSHKTCQMKVDWHWQESAEPSKCTAHLGSSEVRLSRTKDSLLMAFFSSFFLLAFPLCKFRVFSHSEDFIIEPRQQDTSSLKSARLHSKNEIQWNPVKIRIKGLGHLRLKRVRILSRFH